MKVISFIKKHAMVVLAGAAIVGFSSFKLINQNSFAGERWFEYTNATNDNDESNPANYVLTPSNGQNPPSCPTGADETCAIHAKPQSSNPERPDLTTPGSVIETRLRAAQ